MKVTPLKIPDVLLIEPDLYGDDRGFFLESWSESKYAEFGMTERFVQDNLSMSRRGTLRGLHLQHPFGQGKLVHVVHGEVFDVAVDVRFESPTFGQWIGHPLSGESQRQIYIPPGFAHGFCVTSDFALFEYKCTEVYHPEAELGVAWDDPELSINWPKMEHIVSPKDRMHPRLGDVEKERLPRYDLGTTEEGR